MTNWRTILSTMNSSGRGCGFPPRVIAGLVILGSFLLPAPLCGQSKVIPVPNCTFSFTLNAVLPAAGGHSAVYDNRTVGCAYWALGFYVNGFTAETVALQSAPDSAGTPGTWVTYIGTVGTGANPSSAFPSSYATVIPTGVYNPWVRVGATAVTGSGTISGIALGWVDNPFGSGGSVSATVTCSGNGCIVIGPTATGTTPGQAPVFVAGVDGNGKTYPLQACTLSAPISITSGTTALLVAGSGTTRVLVCELALVPASAVSVQLIQGSGATCGTGTASLTGALPNVTAIDFEWGTAGGLVTAAGKGVCLVLGSAVNTYGVISYSQY